MSYFSNFAALAALLTTCLSIATLTDAHDGRGRNFKIQPYKPPHFWVPSPNIKAQHVLNMRRKPGQKPHNAAYLQALKQGVQVEGVYGTEEVDVTDTGLVFATSVEVGGKEYEMVIDTGSSDTWLPKQNFQCVQIGTGDIRSQSDCRLASTYTPSSTFRALQNLNYHVQYLDGEELRGTFGLETITVADITVKNQQFALVDTAAWNGDTATSGLLGLAFPAATKAFAGNNYLTNSPTTQRIYNPIFTNMYTRGHVAPLFSIALDRDQGGQLAIGGLPPVSFFPIFASSPFQLLTTGSSDTEGTSSSSAYTLYTITTNGFSYANASATQWNFTNAISQAFGPPSDPTEVQVIIDTATVNIFLPPATADAVNALFSPPPLYRTNTGLYVVKCDAQPPRFGVKIGFETFYVNPEDMVVPFGSRCISAIAATGRGGTSILGEAFLKNVLAVFDVGAQMMRFAARENY